MLQKLLIKNYAIIDHLVFEPGKHLNTVTGETGAGKSIVFGALSLILGERADTSVLINKDEKCVVEGFFYVKGNVLFKAMLEDVDVEYEDTCIIRREISKTGKSRAFVNDTPVTLTVLNNLTSLLVDLHQQFGHLALEDDVFQVNVLDAIAANGSLLKTYQSIYHEYRNLIAELDQLTAQQSQIQKEADYNNFLLEELVEAGFKENEVEDAELQLKQLNSAERILAVLQEAKVLLNESEQPIVNELKRLNNQIATLEDLLPDTQTLNNRIASAYIELQDIANELESLQGKISIDEELAMQLQDRVDIGYKLFKKHQVNTTQELLEIQQGLENKAAVGNDLTLKIEQLVKQKLSKHKELTQAAKDISDKRKSIIPNVTSDINKSLALVGMPNAAFDIQITDRKEPSLLGSDSVTFVLDANKSGNMQPVYKAASGGEASRIMLCIKSLTAKAMDMPTLIFDEVDTGISGEAARQVGILLHDLARYHQVICITHQPQVAAKGDMHFYVYKGEESSGRITTKLRVLEQEERVLAIAKMIGGEQPSNTALQNAKELIEI